jgi:glutamyl-tRNA synthetase
VERPLRTRFAPTPSGDLHLGGALTALVAFVRARASGGRFVVRVEDLDPPRTVAGATARIAEDLDWLGLAEDEGIARGGPYPPYAQSERFGLYEETIRRLGERVYPCTCSRAEIARAATAPHLGEEGPRYPGTCRDPRNRRPDRAPALRFRVEDGPAARVDWVDRFAGAQREDVAARVGDFVLRRADGVFAYQLAVIVDDCAMQIDEVVRGDDLLGSTARQIMLARALGQRPPTYGHLPVVRGPDGERLAKRHQSGTRGTTVRELRAAGFSPAEILDELARALGVDVGPSRSRDEALERLIDHADALRPTTWTPPPRWCEPR